MNLAPRIISRDFRPGFMVELMQKDLWLVMEAAESMGVSLPATSLIQQAFNSLQYTGESKSGTQEIVKVLERLSNVEVGQNTN
jgi:3-hydroxyisobutyrate dehydrogenase-like beta-hydroxyacid dehydrogenase